MNEDSDKLLKYNSKGVFLLSESAKEAIDEVYRNRWRTLLSVDDLVSQTIQGPYKQKLAFCRKFPLRNPIIFSHNIVLKYRIFSDFFRVSLKKIL